MAVATVRETLESKITPIELSFSTVRFFESDKQMLRSFLVVNSLDLGVLSYEQYRFVARRTRVGNHLVRRHFQKLFREIPTLLLENPEIVCFTVPVYARLLQDSDLATMLVDLLSLYPEVPPAKVCIELSADILYEDLDVVAKQIEELRALGLKIAIFEVGDQFCPVFRLSEIKFDFAFMDAYSTASLGEDSMQRVAGSLVRYLHHLDAEIIAPSLDSDKKIEGARAVGADGYTVKPAAQARDERGEVAE